MDVLCASANIFLLLTARNDERLQNAQMALIIGEYCTLKHLAFWEGVLFNLSFT